MRDYEPQVRPYEPPLFCLLAAGMQRRVKLELCSYKARGSGEQERHWTGKWKVDQYQGRGVTTGNRWAGCTRNMFDREVGSQARFQHDRTVQAGWCAA